MNRKRKIYRGFNRRRHTNKLKVITIILCLCLISGYTYVKIKNSNIFTSNNIFTKLVDMIPFDKISFLDNFKLKVQNFESDDISDELNKVQKEKDLEIEKEEEKETSTTEKSEDVKLAIIEGWTIHTIQVASIEGDKDINKIQDKLTDSRLPFSMLEIDGLKKVQTYSFFDQEITRSYLESVRKVFPDAFISQMKVPTLSLEYTNKYAYIDSISNELNKLITNFEEESKFWTNNKEKVDLESYNKILTSRKKIVEIIEKETEKINYSEMKSFKSDLIKYTKDISEKIDMASKEANEGQYHKSQSLLISSMQGYFMFVNSIKEA